MTIMPTHTDGTITGTDPTAVALRRTLRTDAFAAIAAEPRGEIARSVHAEHLAAMLPLPIEPAPSGALRRAVAWMLLGLAHRVAADVYDPFTECYAGEHRALHQTA